MRLIFLDIDGVLNTHDFNRESMSNCIHRDKVNILNWIIGETDARIVLSSAWRYHHYRGEMSIVGLDWLLRIHGVKAMPDRGPGYEPLTRLHGITRRDTMLGPDFKVPKADERGDQIARYVDLVRTQYGNEPLESYVVLDDGGTDYHTGKWTDMGISAAGHPFVRINGNEGITLKDAYEAAQILTGELLC